MTNSTSGLGNLKVVENLVVKAKDICSIIKVCAKSGVKTLQIPGLNVVFDSIDQLDQRAIGFTQTRVTDKKALQISEEEISKATKLERLNHLIDDLKLEDPEDYESFMEAQLGAGGADSTA